MNLRTKHILAISGIALASGAIGYLLGRKHKAEPETMVYVTNLQSDIMTNALKNLCSTSDEYEYFETEHGRGIRTKSFVPDWIPSPLEEATEEDRRKLTELKKHVRRYTDGLQEVAEAITESALEEDEDDPTDENENLRTQGETEYTSDEPYIVEEDEVFTEETNPDDVATLSYYQDDDVLADSYDEIVSERSEILGNHILDVLRNSKSGEVVYVRNPITKRDYEVIVVDASYEIDVLGADEEQYKNAVKFFKLGDK